MSIGNLKDQGNKGNNFPYQLRNLQLLGDILISLSTGGSGALTAILENVTSKMNRIQGSDDYNRAFTYDANQNVDTITHTGTTLLGVEQVVETFTYDVNQNVTNIAYS
jgi:hypothetical protein